MALKNKLQLATFFISMVMLTGCGGGDSAVTPAVTPAVVTTPVTIQSLEGSWRTACQASKALDGYDQQDIVTFKGNTRTTTKFFYTRNTNCKHSAEVLREREVAGIELGAVVTPGTNTSHTKINITPTKVMLAPMNSTLEALLNNTGHTSMQSIYNGYGLTNWKIFLWKDLFSIDAAKTNFKINQVVPDIWQISEKMVDGQSHKVLKIGVQGGNLDSDGRPIVLATSITAIQQNKTTSTQTAQAAGLIGKWTYPCRHAKGHPSNVQRKSLDFEGNKLITAIDFYTSSQPICDSDAKRLYQVKIEADIVLGKVINKGETNEHTQIGIKTTKVEIMLDPLFFMGIVSHFNEANFYNTGITDIYSGYGQTGWQRGKWKDISGVPDAIKKLNIGTQVPDIFKISTVTGGGKELKMGDYQGTFDINGRAMSLEAKGATLQ